VLSLQEICEKNIVYVFPILACLIFSGPKEKLLVAWKQLCVYVGLVFFSGNGFLTDREPRTRCIAEVCKFNFLAVLCYLQK